MVFSHEKHVRHQNQCLKLGHNSVRRQELQLENRLSTLPHTGGQNARASISTLPADLFALSLVRGRHLWGDHMDAFEDEEDEAAPKTSVLP